jgi:hypothetical protein
MTAAVADGLQEVQALDPFDEAQFFYAFATALRESSTLPVAKAAAEEDNAPGEGRGKYSGNE